MCGIVGILNRDPQAPVAEETLWSMLAPVQNRGPDHQAVWTQPGVGLGHVRLSILDLESRSNQPFYDPDTGFTVTYNGEIYNYLELRDELRTLGHVFQTQSDTEVLIKAYAQWGVDCLNKFNGMWAFALYNPNNQTLFCARDRFGVKPFVYAVGRNHLVFASEAKSIRAAFAKYNTPNIAFTRQFLETGNFAGTEETFYRDVLNLLPGHYFVVNHGECPEQKRYWQWQPQLLDSVPSLPEVLATFQSLLEDAIRVRFRSDVPVGVCLSGGLDSSSIVALASKLFESPIETFSCIYPGLPKLDESVYIQQTTQQFGCKSHWVEPQFENLAHLMEQSVWEQDGPTGTPAVLSQRAVMASAYGHVKVLLDGQGADEILGGYHSYFPYSLQTLMRDFLRCPSPQNLFHYLQSSKAIQERTGDGGPGMWRLFKQCRRPAQFTRHSAAHSILNEVKALPHDALTTKLLEDLVYNTLPQLLHYEDRNSMAFSLESRLPFLDYRLAEFLFGLPHWMKIHQSRTKTLLFETVKDILPPSVVYRKDKMGYATPGQQWFARPSDRALLQGYFEKVPLPLLCMQEEMLAGLKRDWERCGSREPIPPHRERVLWRYLTTCLWLDGVNRGQQISNVSSAGILFQQQQRQPLGV